MNMYVNEWLHMLPKTHSSGIGVEKKVWWSLKGMRTKRRHSGKSCAFGLVSISSKFSHMDIIVQATLSILFCFWTLSFLLIHWQIIFCFLILVSFPLYLLNADFCFKFYFLSLRSLWTWSMRTLKLASLDFLSKLYISTHNYLLWNPHHLDFTRNLTLDMP